MDVTTICCLDSVSGCTTNRALGLGMHEHVLPTPARLQHPLVTKMSRPKTCKLELALLIKAHVMLLWNKVKTQYAMIGTKFDNDLEQPTLIIQ